MKYVRTKDDVIELNEKEQYINGIHIYVSKKINERDYYFKDDDILKQADNIEELCDEFVCQENDYFYWLASRENVSFRDLPNCYCKAIFGAIWTDRGLIYVAKMNENGELELL